MLVYLLFEWIIFVLLYFLLLCLQSKGFLENWGLQVRRKESEKIEKNEVLHSDKLMPIRSRISRI